MKKLILLLTICCVCVCSVGTVAFAEEEISIVVENGVVLEDVPSATPIVEEFPELPTQETPVITQAPTITTAPEAIPEETLPSPEPDSEFPFPIYNEEIPGPSENTVDFSTTIAPTIVNVTIPLNVDVYINPNEDDGFLYGAIEVQNHTKAPVVVSIKDFQTGTIPFQRCIAPYELPNGLSWNNMSVTQTQQFFSLGIRPIVYNGKTWAEEFVHDYVYAKNGFIQTRLGVISGQQTAYLGLRSFYGKAFTEEKRFQFSATFVVELKQ